MACAEKMKKKYNFVTIVQFLKLFRCVEKMFEGFGSNILFPLFFSFVFPVFFLDCRRVVPFGLFRKLSLLLTKDVA